MDIEIPSDEKLKQKKKLVFKIALAAVAIIAICFIIILFTRSSIPYNGLATSTVDNGTLEVTISASGRVVPLYEEIIVSPINSRILEVYKNAGDTLIEGDSILKLELASVETDYNQKLDELEIRKSKLAKTKVTVANRISALKTQARIKEMQLKQLYTEFKNEHYVDSIGASTKDKVRQAELNHEVARLELEQLNELIDIERKNGDTDIDVQEIELRIFEKTLNESRRLLNDARILASQSGTLSFINNQIGAQVEAGTQLAILSDLSAFKVEGEIADTYAERMSIGSKAAVKAGGVELEGTVVNITPSVKNGVIKFIVMLKEPGNKSLRSGLKTDVYIMQDIRENTLRVRTSSYYIGPGMYDLWVISGNQAEKRQVELGQSNYQYAEVISGLLQGDEVIISDMKKHKDKSTIKINH